MNDLIDSYNVHYCNIGIGLPKKFRERGHDFLVKINPLYYNAQLKLEIGDETFYDSKLLNKEILKGEVAITASQWWELMGSVMGSKLPIGFAGLAKNLMMLPASTSAIERCFSTMGSIITDTRNRLGIEKASKLCLAYRSLNSDRLADK